MIESLFWIAFGALWVAVWIGGVIAIHDEFGDSVGMILVIFIAFVIGPPVFAISVIWDGIARIKRRLDNDV